MKKIALILLAFTLSFLSHSSFAITAENGYYMGANYGLGIMVGPTASTNDFILNYIGSIFPEAWGVQGGYSWQINPNASYGLELQYTQNGAAFYTGTGKAGDNGSLTYKSNSVNLLGALSYNWNNGINVFGKLGAALVTQTAVVSGPIYIYGVQHNNSRNSITQLLPKFELGIGFMPTQHFNIYLVDSIIMGKMGDDWSSIANGLNSTVYTTGGPKLGFNYLF